MGSHGLISRSSRRVLGVLLVAVIASLAASSTAQASETSSQAAFRQQFMAYITQMGHVATTLKATAQGREAYAQLNLDPSAGVARARSAVARMTPAQLSQFQTALSLHPQWQSVPQTLQHLVDRTSHPRRRRSLFITPDDCATAEAAGYTQTDVEIGKDAALTADIALEAIPDDTLAVVAHVAAVALWAVPQVALRVIEHSYEIANNCQQNDAQATIANNLDVKVSSRATQSSLDSLTNNFNTFNTAFNTFNDAFNTFNNTFSSLNTLVNNRLDTTISSRASQTSLTDFNNQFTTNATLVNTKLDSITTSVTNANTKLDNLTVTVNNNGALDLRLKIEEDLSQPGLHPIALFEIPASAGGYLNLARTIVADIIAKMQSVGESVGTAPSFLAAADTSITAHDYRGAYQNLGKAYRAASGGPA
jgi:hypothetical protein